MLCVQNFFAIIFTKYTWQHPVKQWQKKKKKRRSTRCCHISIWCNSVTFASIQAEKIARIKSIISQQVGEDIL